MVIAMTQSTIDDYIAVQNRNESYAAIMPDIGRRQAQVLAVIGSHYAISNAGISEELNLGINQVTPRVKELRELGLVEAAGSVLDEKTSRKVTTWKVRG